MTTTFRTIPLSRLVRPARALRAKIDLAKIDALAASIRAVGQLEPLLVRPLPDDGDRYEIVAGDRRFLALAKANKSQVDVRIDSEIGLAHSVAENTGREDLTPVEEARAYLRMREEDDETVEEIAAIVCRPVEHVRARLRLASCPEVIALVDAGRIGHREAAFLAGLHADVRARVVSRVQDGRGDVELGTLHDLADESAVRLTAQADEPGAPFDTTDATLDAEAGPCTTCSANTAVQRDLFGARDAICLDVPCFARKAGAVAMRERDEAVAAGIAVVEGSEAERVRMSSDFVALSSPCHEWARANPGKHIDGRIPTWGELLRASAHTDVGVTVALVTDSLGITRVERLMRARDKSRVLGNIDARASEEAAADREVEDPDKKARAEERAKRAAEVEEVTFRRLCEVAHFATVSHERAIEIACRALLASLPSRVLEVVALRRELAKKGADYAHALEVGVVRTNPDAIEGLVLELVLAKGRDDIGSKTPTLAGDVLDVLEVDLPQVRGEVKRDLEKRDEAQAAKRGEGRVRKRRTKKSETVVSETAAEGEPVALVGEG